MRIIQISDLHFSDDPSFKKAGKQPKEELIKTFNDIEKSAHHDDIIVLSGDLVLSPCEELYTKLSNFLSEKKFTFYAIPGNHDDYSLMKSHFFTRPNILSNTYFHFGNNWLIMLMDSSHPGKNLGSGRILETDFLALKNSSDNNPEKNIIVFLHHPPISFGASWFQNICLENSQKFIETINTCKNIKHVISGHAHTSHNIFKDDILYICAPSSWVQFNHKIDETCTYTKQPPGYNTYELKEDGSFSFTSIYV